MQRLQGETILQAHLARGAEKALGRKSCLESIWEMVFPEQVGTVILRGEETELAR